MEQTLSRKETRQGILRSVPFEKGFHFTNENGIYTGITATNLANFYSELVTIDINSILFHYPRGDFQKWIQYTLGDKELADRLMFTTSNMSGEKLRKHLLKIVQKRITELGSNRLF